MPRPGPLTEKTCPACHVLKPRSAYRIRERNRIAQFCRECERARIPLWDQKPARKAAAQEQAALADQGVSPELAPSHTPAVTFQERLRRKITPRVQDRLIDRLIELATGPKPDRTAMNTLLEHLVGTKFGSSSAVENHPLYDLAQSISRIALAPPGAEGSDGDAGVALAEGGLHAGAEPAPLPSGAGALGSGGATGETPGGEWGGAGG